MGRVRESGFISLNFFHQTFSLTFALLLLSIIQAMSSSSEDESTIAPPPVASTSTAASSFTSLGVSPFLSRALGAMSIRQPTPVQSACIPQILSGADCIGSAQTGSGKTIAFALPILQQLSKDPVGFFAIVLTPTR